MITTIIVILILAVVAARIVMKQRRAAAAILPDGPLEVSEVDANIRADVAPEARPYGDGGVISDEKGQTYAVATDGSVRRFAIAEKADGEKEVVLVRKAGKAARKAAKRAKRDDRGMTLAPVSQAARSQDRESATKLARVLAH